MTTVDFFALKLFCGCISAFAGFLFAPMFVQGNITGMLLIAFVFGLILPQVWLSKRIKAKKEDIARELPPVIDLLNLCVSAGLDFMQATKKVIANYKPCYLIEELKILNKEIGMGTSRHNALKNMAWRINLPEVSSFVRTLVQTDKVGAPVRDALTIQSEEIKTRRFQRGEEQAMKSPVKLLFPLLVFILPVVMAIVAGPIILNFLNSGSMKF